MRFLRLTEPISSKLPGQVEGTPGLPQEAPPIGASQK